MQGVYLSAIVQVSTEMSHNEGKSKASFVDNMN